LFFLFLRAKKLGKLSGENWLLQPSQFFWMPLLFYKLGCFFLFFHREILGEWGVFQQEILQFCSIKHESGEQLYFFMFSFFSSIYIMMKWERELYNGKWKKQRSYQREETRRKGCEIHIKKYIDEYSTMWPKFFGYEVAFHFYFYFFLPATI